MVHTTFEHIKLLITSISIHIRLVVVYIPPQSNINKTLKCNLLWSLWRSCRHAAVDCYFVEISTLIGWIRKTRVLKLLNLLETYNLVQHITEPTHRSQHLLDYIISDAELVNSADVSYFVSDHCALRASLVCTRSHPKQKQITFRPLKLLIMIYCLLILVKSI